ncbi:MAG: molybdopterin converting factor subunit 1 [Gammaproteobacteria bacterium]|nr:MAG: molybdopterin converting factor subunit 1 [Gammaproteobacteria bacterium]UCH41417.1 MAG: molybdopterin converting factor subunit 1 [Gammaproteobacteria bacterium]
MAEILYFASLAETLGLKSEQIELPADCATVDDLVQWLRKRGEPFAGAFDGSTRILVAINQEMCEPSAAINGSDEIAFFPPVTGG